VRDAWLYTTQKDSASRELGAALVELGYRPRYLSERESTIAPRDGAAVRPPEVAIVVTGSGEAPALSLLRRLRASEQLRNAPVLLTVDPEHLRSPEVSLAHDLLVRPFSIDELRARVDRATRELLAAAHEDVVREGALQIDLAAYRVSVGDRQVELRYMEYELLKFLVTHPNRVFSREALLSSVWGYDYYGGARTVDTHVRRVRLKLGVYAERIKTVRSVGYLFETGERLGYAAG